MQTLIKNGLFFSGRADEKALKQDVLIDEFGRIKDVGPCNSFKEEGLRIIEADGKWVVQALWILIRTTTQKFWPLLA